MNYEINVSLNGAHFFATHKRSLQDADTMKKVVGVFKEKFPRSEGYKIAVSKHTVTSGYINPDTGEAVSYTKDVREL